MPQVRRRTEPNAGEPDRTTDRVSGRARRLFASRLPSGLPGFEAVPRPSFEDAFAAVREGQAERAMIPIDNSIAGRVADIHHLMPHCGLHIIGEHFQRVNHHLLACRARGSRTSRRCTRHVHALNQCRRLLRELELAPKVHADTAGAAAEVAETGRRIRPRSPRASPPRSTASRSCAPTSRTPSTTPRAFIVLAREAREPPPDEGPVITSFLFQVRNVPAALYKALGGFATNGVNMIKLESYVDARFAQAAVLRRGARPPGAGGAQARLRGARVLLHEVERLGVYPADPFRFQTA